jgi:hypothetical protein
MMPFDNEVDGVSVPIPVGGAVQFPQDGPTNGAATRLSNSTFNLPAVGMYAIKWQASITQSGQLQVALNGTGVATTIFGRERTTCQIVGSTIITTSSPNTVLSILNPVGNPQALTLTRYAGDNGVNPVSATLTIEQLA